MIMTTFQIKFLQIALKVQHRCQWHSTHFFIRKLNRGQIHKLESCVSQKLFLHSMNRFAR